MSKKAKASWKNIDPGSLDKKKLHLIKNELEKMQGLLKTQKKSMEEFIKNLEKIDEKK